MWSKLRWAKWIHCRQPMAKVCLSMLGWWCTLTQKRCRGRCNLAQVLCQDRWCSLPKVLCRVCQDGWCALAKILCWCLRNLMPVVHCLVHCLSFKKHGAKRFFGCRGQPSGIHLQGEGKKRRRRWRKGRSKYWREGMNMRIAGNVVYFTFYLFLLYNYLN